MFCSLHSVHLLYPVCLQRFLAGTVQSSFAAGCYSGSLWRESLDTFKKKKEQETYSAFFKLHKRCPHSQNVP